MPPNDRYGRPTPIGTIRSSARKQEPATSTIGVSAGFRPGLLVKQHMLLVACIQGNSGDFPRTRRAHARKPRCCRVDRKIVAAPNLHGSTSNRRFKSDRDPTIQFPPVPSASAIFCCWACWRRSSGAPESARGNRLRTGRAGLEVWFEIVPPQKRWTVIEHAYDSVVYVRSSDSEGDETGWQKSCPGFARGGALPVGGTASAGESGFAKAALNFLSDRFRPAAVKPLDLKTAPYSPHGSCAPDSRRYRWSYRHAGTTAAN